jgi:predicted nucleotidyltransferase
MQETMADVIIRIVAAHYPAAQGIYLFGSQGEGSAWPGSDVDIALLLPHDQARREQALSLSQCRFDLEQALGREVDLVNARQVSTVFQKEIISGRLLKAADRYAVDEFEMLVMSYYQKLNEERQGILEAFRRTGRAYDL